MNPREVIITALEETYGWASSDFLNKWVADYLIDHKMFDFDNVLNIVWANYPGGGTAAIATDKILAALLDLTAKS